MINSLPIVDAFHKFVSLTYTLKSISRIEGKWTKAQAKKTCMAKRWKQYHMQVLTSSDRGNFHHSSNKKKGIMVGNIHVFGYKKPMDNNPFHNYQRQKYDIWNHQDKESGYHNFFRKVQNN
ncbi:ectonucleotide pyrophosphatase/phosphodiesterasefamily member 2, partial [Striga asiatica]